MRIYNVYNPEDHNYGSFCDECIAKFGHGTEVICTEITDQMHDINFWNSHIETCELCWKEIRVKTFTAPSVS